MSLDTSEPWQLRRVEVLFDLRLGAFSVQPMVPYARIAFDVPMTYMIPDDADDEQAALIVGAAIMRAARRLPDRDP